MDLEVVGRHAMLFDDDAMAAFCNSSDALVEWNSLSIDRYDVRHLLSSPLPQRRRNRKFDPSLADELSLEAELDHQRYLDLPVVSDETDLEKDGCGLSADYQAVAFSYGNADDTAVPKDGGATIGSSEFHPPFSVPPDIHSLPESEKAHQIIAKTALFVRKHGGQSEIILRVKQGDNPTFGFLMPGHELHAYFRYIVEHPQLVSESEDSSGYNKPKDGVLKQNASNIHSSIGALSLLGSVYGNEEEDVDNSAGLEKEVSMRISEPDDNSSSHNSRKIEIKADTDKSESVSTNLVLTNKEKFHHVKNSSVTAPKSGNVKGLGDKTNSGYIYASKSDAGKQSKIKPLLLEPPPELQRLIAKVVEYIIRNGKQFEAMLIEQDREHGRFPFLLPSNQFHAYYLKILQDSHELKIMGKDSSSHDDNYASAQDKYGFLRKESDFSPLESGVDDILFESEKKEKFKMVINKPKKETTETEPSGSRVEPEFTVDAASAAAILEAATRGIKRSISIASPVDHDVPGTAAFIATEASGEHSALEMRMTKERKLKAERLKRAKNFVAMLKNQELPFKTGESRCSSLEPATSGGLRSADEKDHHGKDKKSTGPTDAFSLDSGLKVVGGEHNERIISRKHRSRPKGYEDGVIDDDGVIKEDSGRSESRHTGVDHGCGHAAGPAQKHNTRRQRDRYSSEEEHGGGSGDHKHDRSKHRSHDSHQEDEYKDKKDAKRSRKKSHSHHSRHEHSKKRPSSSSKGHDWEGYENDDDHGDKKRSRRKHNLHGDRERQEHKRRHSRRDKEPRQHSKHYTSSDDEHQSLHEHKKKRHRHVDPPEDGVYSESKHRNTIQEASADAPAFPERAPSQPSDTNTEVPDDLRAKIRALLIATRL